MASLKVVHKKHENISPRKACVKTEEVTISQKNKCLSKVPENKCTNKHIVLYIVYKYDCSLY